MSDLHDLLLGLLHEAAWGGTEDLKIILHVRSSAAGHVLEEDLAQSR